MTTNFVDQAAAMTRYLAAQAASSELGASYMLALGAYRFSIDTAAYQSLSREMAYLWPTQQRVGGTPSPQFVGRGEFKRSLNGVIYSDYKGGFKQVDAMAAQAGLGQPLLLVAGTGEVLGYWCITNITETATAFYRNGQPRKLEFSLALLFYGDRYPE